MFIVKIHKSVLLTYLGVIFATISMYLALTGYKLRYSLIFLILSGICDMFDGKVARMCKRNKMEKEFGIQIDSLADTINFICTPVIIMITLGMKSIYDIIIYTLFILCGIARLAFFNANADMDNPVKFYSGMPVTSTAIIYPTLGILYKFINITTFKLIYIVATAITALLFVLNIKVPKPKGKWFYIIIPILAIGLITFMIIK